MRRFLPLIRTLCLIILGMGHLTLGIAAQPQATSMQQIKARGKLVVCTAKKERVPFFFIDDNGNPAGIEADLARYIANELGVELNLIQTDTFDEVISSVEKEECDIGISKLSFTLLRAEKVLFTKPYAFLRRTVVMNRVELGHVRIQGNESLKEIFSNSQRKIGVVKDSAYVEFAKRLFPKADIKAYASWTEEIIPKLLDGTLLGVFRDEWEVLKIMRSVPGAPLRLLAVRIKNKFDPIHMVVPFGKPDLLAWLNGYLNYKDIRYSVDDLTRRLRAYERTHRQDVPKVLTRSKTQSG